MCCTLDKKGQWLFYKINRKPYLWSNILQLKETKQNTNDIIINQSAKNFQVIYFLCMSILPICLHGHYHIRAQTFMLKRPEEGIGFPEPRVIVCEPPCGF